AATEPALADERLLIHELTHRIINEFTSVATMMSLAAARSPNIEARAALEPVMSRLDSYIRVHRPLQLPPPEQRLEATAHRRELCRSMSDSRLAQKRVQLGRVARARVLDSEQCWLLGMIVFELINNAVRHAFAEGGGEIRVEAWHADGVVACRVSDDGRAPITMRRGRGLRIIA